MDWENVKFAMLGRDGDDGTCALDELDAEIQRVGRECLDMRTSGNGVVTAKIVIRRTGPGALVITPAITTRQPGRERLGLGAILADGSIQAVEHKQLDIGDAARAFAERREIEANEHPESREQVTARKRSLSAERRARGAESEVDSE